MSGAIFKMKNDPRITRIGKIIRSTSIDELPQLFNVLAGQMSHVGPRPTVPYEVEQYTEEQKQRFIVTPGLTCYYQVAPDRYDFDFETCFGLDLKYIREQSFLLDMKLIFKTIRIILGGLSH
jgi:lipopolysaccharide/colanic/teichoic acid biosynthesis glycosyltransferase